jgi:ABC-type transporter Mla subunit MlaD
VLLVSAIGFLVLAVAVLLLWVLPGHRRPFDYFDYMVAGTFATTITLISVFILFAKHR